MAVNVQYTERTYRRTDERTNGGRLVRSGDTKVGGGGPIRLHCVYCANDCWPRKGDNGQCMVSFECILDMLVAAVWLDR